MQIINFPPFPQRPHFPTPMGGENNDSCQATFEDSSLKTLCGKRMLKEQVLPTGFTWMSTPKPGRSTIIIKAASSGEEVKASVPHPDHDYDQKPLPVEEQLEEARNEIARQAEEIAKLQANQFLFQHF